MGVTEHIIGTLEAFGLDRAYQRENLSGCAMDDQYIRLNVSDHLSNIFVNDYHITWDPADRIELIIKDSNSNEKQSFIESVTDTIQSTMKLLSYGKPHMDLLNEAHLSDHFLIPKLFKSMKFVGHCSSVLQSFSSDFKGIESTLEKMNTLESIYLQEAILNMDFILDFLMMRDIMSHITICSKSVQRGCVLPWMFPEIIYSTIQTLTCFKDSLVLSNLQSSSLLNKELFSNFFQCHEIVINKEYKNCPLTILPVSTARTRSRIENSDENSGSSDKFLINKIGMYLEYISKLSQNIEKRFYCGTFDVCINMGKLLNFNWLIYPQFLRPWVCDRYLRLDFGKLFYFIGNNSFCS